MNPTEAQKASIEYEGGHLFIEAGAGTGKTATLTAKIAHHLSTGNRMAFDHIEELLAITFTEKAAGELVGRIRSILRTSGMGDEALLVDGAWVSTIHGMCSRMLRDHAFELGIDPGFEVVTDTRVGELKVRALEEVISDLDDASVDDLFEEYRSVDAMYGDSTVAGMIGTLMEKISLAPGGGSEVELGPRPMTTAAVARSLQTVSNEYADFLDASGDDSRSGPDAIAHARSVSERLTTAMEDGSDNLRAVLLEIFDERLCVSGKRKGGIAEATASYRAMVARLQGEFALGISYPLLEHLISLSQLVGERYGAYKRRDNLLDSNDLLILLHRSFAEHPEIARTYAEQFKLIMVDEFQDTDALQLSIVGMMDRLGDGQLVTVGDAQQSIYRFRGADVNLFRSFQRSLPPDSDEERLDTNFRSHPEILHFVNRLFSHPSLLGSGYLKLNPPATGGARGASDLAGLPRVDIIGCISKPGSRVSTDDLVRMEARSIAARFLEYAKRGHALSEMVILLGKMSRASVFSDELRRVGLTSVIAGGSVFWRQSPEPGEMGALLRFLANPYDNEAAHLVLVSQLFELDEQHLALLALDETGKRRPLYDGLCAVLPSRGDDGRLHGIPGRGGSDIHAGVVDDGADAFDDPRLLLASQLLVRAVREVGERSASRIAERLIAESGLMTRLESRGAEGRSSAANYLKAIRQVRVLEDGGTLGARGLAMSFQALLRSGLGESPGVLTQKGQDAVRIMTIHSSKGLEFPIVALAEFAEQTSSDNTQPKLLIENVSDRLLISLAPARSIKMPTALDDDGAQEAAAESPCRASTALEFRNRLDSWRRREETAGRIRLFYVGATRAREALLISTYAKLTKTKGLSPSPLQKGISVLFQGGELPLEDTEVDYGGAAKARYTCYLLDSSENALAGTGHGDLDGDTAADMCPHDGAISGTCHDPGSFVPVLSAPDEPVRSAPARDPEDLEFSYSSISADGHPSVPDEPVTFSSRLEDDLGRGRDSARLHTPEDGEHGDAFTLGLAFHQTAEHMVATRLIGDALVQSPDGDYLEGVSRRYGLTAGQRERYRAAVATWVASPIAARVAGHGHVRAEVPLYLPFETTPGGEPVYLTGEIDLLCFDDVHGEALIVDYKTGGSRLETPGELLDKHRLQGMCYTLAALEAGFESVEVVFVRVEQLEDDGSPQTVVYQYGRRDEGMIRGFIGKLLHAGRMDSHQRI